MSTASSGATNLDDVFKKAAIGVAFDKSSILQNIKHEKYATHDLVKLLNMYNSHSMAEIPIIVIKFVTRLVATTVTNKFTVLQKYINPENIDISIAPDELNFIINNHKPANTHNIVFIVAKNILTSLFGISASNLDQQLLQLIEKTKNDVEDDASVADSSKTVSTKTVEELISSSPDDYTIPTIKVPSIVAGGFGSNQSASSTANSDDGDVYEEKINRNNVKLIDKFKRLEDYTKRTHTEAFYDRTDNEIDGDESITKRVKSYDYDDLENSDDTTSKITEINNTDECVDMQISDATNEIDDTTIKAAVEPLENEDVCDVITVNTSDNDDYDDNDDGYDREVDENNNNNNNTNNINNDDADDDFCENRSESSSRPSSETIKIYDEIDISEDNNDDLEKLNTPKIIEDVFINKKIVIHKNAPAFDQAMSAGNYIDDLISTLQCDADIKNKTIADHSDYDSDC